jgi:hypothetical protein
MAPSRFELRAISKEAYSCLDIVIDGQPLATLFKGRLGAVPDLISPLGWSNPGTEEHQAHQFRRFLMEAAPDLPHDRNSILVCRECGDLGCGAYSAVFRREGDIVTWSRFGFQKDYDEASLIVDPYEHIPALSFLWRQYETELRRYGGV